ncbi:MAG TPA: response regulator [Candidatus Acidoferrales bacterium]|nr:response regulator [Candidatus Acidoferrales bacterium]
MERILVIDDDETICNTISRTLRFEGYEVDVANTGRQAIECSERRFYNLALIDMRLPDMEGTELLTAMKKTTPKMVKIILTGNATLHNSITAINRGVDGYLTKPVEMDVLLKTIKEHLLNQSTEKEFDERRVGEYIETQLRKMDRA